MANEAQLPSIGRIVHYVPEPGTKEASNFVEEVPAIVVRTFGGTSANLKIFTDGPADTWRTSVPYSEEKKENSWHWPERV